LTKIKKSLAVDIFDFDEPNMKYDTVYHGTVVGNMQQLQCGVEYDLKSTLVFSDKYKSWQYKVINIISQRPQSNEEQKLFLQSIVTERQADILLSAYPTIVDDVISGVEIDLSKTNGIKDATFSVIKAKILENYVIADILILLQPLGVSYNMIKKLTDDEPNPVLLKQKLIDNPYILTDIDGLGFKRVDKLALKLNPELELSTKRVYACISFILEDIGSSEGHTWIYLSQLMSEIRDNIPECVEIFKDIINTEKENDVILHIVDNQVGLKKYYNNENKILRLLNELQNSPINKYNLNFEEAINKTELKLGFKLTQEQIDAISSLNDNNIILITGSAGSGKSTVLQGILNLYRNECNIAMTALAAKACQRIKEVTGFPAITIHRLLGWKNGEFIYNEENKLREDLIIIDEASMVNSYLFLSLIKSIKKGAKFVIVFDFAQLPPIGAGNIASDLLHSNFKINKFTKIHRQAEKSGILVDANKIRVGDNPLEEPQSLITHGELKDMHYMFREDTHKINDLVVQAYIKALDVEDIDNVAIIVPRKKDCINSTQEINARIQDLLISDDVPFLLRGKQKFKQGAKVIQKVNDYEKGVVNGEIGYLKFIGTDFSFVAVFDNGEKEIHYSKGDVSDIELAYALTVHSCQGSQWKKIICAIDMSHFMLLDSCLLYTAITRASKECLLIAEPRAYMKCIENNKGKVRQTYLKELINNLN
jgi:exodeoxyribonuclease V alpha subunit